MRASACSVIGVASRSSPCAAKADFLGQPPPGEADLKAAHAELVALRLRHDESKREWREQKAALRFLASQRASRIAALEAELAAARKCPAVAITITPVAGAPAEASSGPAARPGAEHMLDLCARNEPGEPGDAFSGEMVAQHVRSAVLVAHEITTMRFTAKQGSRRFYPLTRRQAAQPRPVAFHAQVATPIAEQQQGGRHELDAQELARLEATVQQARGTARCLPPPLTPA